MTTYDLQLSRPRVLSELVAVRLPLGARSALLVAAGAGLVGLSAQLSVPLPGTPVPVTGQTFAVLLVGAVLGWQQAAASMAVYLLAGGLGVPWLSHGGSGFGGATFGYVVGFVVAAPVVGWLASRGGDRTVARSVATMALGTALIYACGLPWLAHSAHLSAGQAWHLGARPFLVGDAIKVGLAAGLLPGAWALARRFRD
ncbi:MAG: biotin transport system substrate-specific component [Frankiales bacterium]|jgi:biotin transport system substrate-specific component|nr:biotin transport system substrate-specific component [Frankiales bacterium]MDX6222903.1 biotin transport system substrate-specific component [Frankiales bacterium]